MTYSEKFTLVDSGLQRWEVHPAGSEALAGHITQVGEEFHLVDSQDNDLGSFESMEHALRVLYGSD